MAVSEKFEFPDEKGKDGPHKKETAPEDQINIEIVDDVPEEDRNRQPLPKEIVAQLDKDDDLDEYSEKVQTRLKTLKKAYHDERRNKEAAARERDEAARFAQAQYQENQTLKQRLSSGEKIFITEVGAAAKAQLEAAREKLRQANASGDADLISAAQEALFDAKTKQERAESFKPSLQEKETPVNNTQQSQAKPPNVDPKADAWRSKNGWFGTDREMTALSLALHEKLMEKGVDPRSDDYYQEIDKSMRKRFPEYFTEDSADDEKETKEEKTSSRKPATVVASASRSTSSKQVKLTSSAASIAKRLGITPEAYARELIKLETK